MPLGHFWVQAFDLAQQTAICWRPLWTVRGKPLPLPAVKPRRIIANIGRTKQTKLWPLWQDPRQNERRCSGGGDRVEGESPFSQIHSIENSISDERTQSNDKLRTKKPSDLGVKEWFPKYMDNKPLTIAVDFDGVIADYDDWKGNENLGSPRQDVIEALRILRSEGWKIVVYSTRGTEEIAPYLIDNKVPFDEINQNSSYQTRGVKPVATIYWDDRACRYSGDARKDLQAILEFRTWNGRR